jgi:hypothetical protein
MATFWAGGGNGPWDSMVEACKDFLFLGEAVFLFFRENELAISDHFKNPSTRGNQFHGDLVALFDSSRQTSGTWLVVSLFAVFN